jgi:hypothetical protein
VDDQIRLHPVVQVEQHGDRPPRAGLAEQSTFRRRV